MTFTLGLIVGLIAAFTFSMTAFLILAASARRQTTPDPEQSRTIDEWFGTGTIKEKP